MTAIIIGLLIPALSCAAESEGMSYSDGDYVIGPQDVLEITVWGNQDLSGKMPVGLDGKISYQFLGEVKAAGLSPAGLARKLTKLLADGYIVNPQVTVKVAEYKSQKVFVMGEVNKPGTVYLTKRTSVVEAISQAGGPTDAADSEIIIVKQGGGEVKVNNGEYLTVDFRAALEGDKTQNVIVGDGDSIYVPEAKTFYIMGEVNKPGRYKLQKGTTVIKAISIGGGTTNKAAMNRTKVVRIVNGKEEEFGIGLNDQVQPNDTLIVPISFF